MTIGERKKKVEYGDFQTPSDLALQVCALLKKNSFLPQTIVEPMCGVGNYISASVTTFPRSKLVLAFDIEPKYVEKTKEALASSKIKSKVEVADFFTKDWKKELENAPGPILIVGNPPWVTNSQLGLLKGENLPVKGNFQGLKGLDAVTGKSNFDISEWMIIQMLEWLQRKEGVIAMLCKTSVARKVLTYAWKNDKKIGKAKIHLIDAPKHFGIATDACLLTITSAGRSEKKCSIYDNLSAHSTSQEIGLRDNYLVANIPEYEATKHLLDGDQYYEWRSGVKHDSSKVMELVLVKDGVYRNGFNEEYELENEYLYPLMKGSDLANGKVPKRFVLVTQKRVGENTDTIATLAPKTWGYLQRHATLLNARASSIYKNKPMFSIFGVGEYTFSLWKVAIPALYKKLEISIIGPHNKKPVVFDDTVNFISVNNKKEAEALASLLNAEMAQRFYNAFIFWDNKRPVTIQLLKSLDIGKLAEEIGVTGIQTKPRNLFCVK